MKIKKAVITAGGRHHHGLALQTVVDRDGVQKTTLRIILEEALSAGVEDVCIVICPGSESVYRAAAGQPEARLHFIEQHDARGYGHAIHCAKDFVANEPFLHLVSDHLYISSQKERCAQLLAEIANTEECSISAVQPTRESMLPYYGVVGGRGVPNRERLFVVESVVEKPTPTEAEQFCMVPGLRAAHYLCFFGMHVLTPSIMLILEEQLATTKGIIQLSPALGELARRERYLACELPGRRYNMGVKFGMLNSQLALVLSGPDRDEVLEQIVELLASHSLSKSKWPES